MLMNLADQLLRQRHVRRADREFQRRKQMIGQFGERGGKLRLFQHRRGEQRRILADVFIHKSRAEMRGNHLEKRGFAERLEQHVIAPGGQNLRAVMRQRTRGQADNHALLPLLRRFNLPRGVAAALVRRVDVEPNQMRLPRPPNGVGFLAGVGFAHLEPQGAQQTRDELAAHVLRIYG